MRIKQAYNQIAERLLQQRDTTGGAWTGRLSSSALSTALGVTALADGNIADRAFVQQGVQWLVSNINSDGGWGDTPGSPSNTSTSLIAHACIARSQGLAGVDEALADSTRFIVSRIGGTSVKSAASKLKEIYGGDKTFSAPILMYLAICSDGKDGWKYVPSLPFYLALLPGWCFRYLKLEVVSYALPALIAVGLCLHISAAEARGRRPWGRLIAARLIAKIADLQPEHGGFLDAVPLTAFVVMALKQCGYGDCTVVQKGSRFIRESIRSDGSTPIDTNLRCWLTSLSARALAPQLAADPVGAKNIVQWIVDRQYLAVHPFTGAEPGGWSWTDQPGGVPDADDTAAALIALFYLKDFTETDALQRTVRRGLNWLIALQNRDGGVPTFCRGWGRLPFDQSACDITAHAIEALALWRGYIFIHAFSIFDDESIDALNKSLSGMVNFLSKQQRPDGSWLPLWFGHQQSDGGLNHIIGTARVLSGLHALRSNKHFEDRSFHYQLSTMMESGEVLLVTQQKSDGGWSAGILSTVEETALAVAALAPGGVESAAAAKTGAAWLADMILKEEIIPAPIGLYFSVLWYYEELYPIIWSTAALKAIIYE